MWASNQNVLTRLKSYASVRSRRLSTPFVKVFQWYLVSRARHPVQAPIFIVGAPRTGSTILYQTLTENFQLRYIDNLACKWNGALLWGLWRSDKRFGARPHGNFKARFGNTTSFGDHAPCECGEFWYRWLPRDRHYIDAAEVPLKHLDEIRSEIESVSAYFGQPLLFKNLNMGQRLKLVAKVFPNAKIIYLQRDPRFVVRSILAARQKLNFPADGWWSVKPKNYLALLPLPEKQRTAAQVFHLQQQIENDLALFDSKNVFTLHYQSLGPRQIEAIACWAGLEKREKQNLPVFQTDRPKNMPPDELDALSELVSKHPFQEQLFI